MYTYFVPRRNVWHYGVDREVAPGVAGVGMAPSPGPDSQTLGQRTNKVCNLSWKRVSLQPVRKRVLIHKLKNQTSVLLKTTGVNSRSAIKVHRSHQEASDM